MVEETAAKAGSEASPSQEVQQELTKAQEELNKVREELNTLKDEVQKKQEEVSRKIFKPLLFIIIGHRSETEVLHCSKKYPSKGSWGFGSQKQSAATCQMFRTKL